MENLGSLRKTRVSPQRNEMDAHGVVLGLIDWRGNLLIVGKKRSKGCNTRYRQEAFWTDFKFRPCDDRRNFILNVDTWSRAVPYLWKPVGTRRFILVRNRAKYECPFV